MNILHIPNYAPPHIGGIEQTAKDILDSMPQGCRQRLFCFHDQRKTVRDELDGVPVTRCGTFAKVSSQPLSACYGRELKKTFRAFRPDLVIFHFPNPFAAHYLLKNLKKYPACKLIVWWHLDITKQKILGKLFRGQTERLLGRAERIVATSPNYLDGSPWLNKFREKCTVIPSCIDEKRLSRDAETDERVRAIRQKYAGKTICLALGRHVPYKGIGYFIEAAKGLKGDYAFLIGGKGELTEELKRQAAEDARIVFLGVLPEEDVKAYLYACDLFCFPSVTKNEAFGLALAEALSCGKPAVTFTIKGSGVNFVSIGGVTGLEAENADADAFGRAIETLARDEALRRKFGEAAKERAKLFTKEVFRKNVQALLETISPKEGGSL